jgi:hypothetical protein
VNVYVKAAPGGKSGEAIAEAPLGTEVLATSWWLGESLFVQVTVLFTPMTRVKLSGAYPGGFAEFEDPLHIETCTAGWLDEAAAETHALEFGAALFELTM